MPLSSFDDLRKMMIHRVMTEVCQREEMALKVAIREDKDLATALVWVHDAPQFIGWRLELCLLPRNQEVALPELPYGNHWNIFNLNSIPQEKLDELRAQVQKEDEEREASGLERIYLQSGGLPKVDATRH